MGTNDGRVVLTGPLQPAQEGFVEQIVKQGGPLICDCDRGFWSWTYRLCAV